MTIGNYWITAWQRHVSFILAPFNYDFRDWKSFPLARSEMLPRHICVRAFYLRRSADDVFDTSSREKKAKQEVRAGTVVEQVPQLAASVRVFVSFYNLIRTFRARVSVCENRRKPQSKY